MSDYTAYVEALLRAERRIGELLMENRGLLKQVKYLKSCTCPKDPQNGCPVHGSQR